jgi:hypothetical protein
MKGKLSTLVFVLILISLILSALIVSGCGTTKKVDMDVPNVEVDVPNVKVNVDVPNVKVDVPNVKVNVDVPNVEVDVDVPNVEATDVIHSSGNMVIEYKPVGDFNRLSLTGVGEVIITQGEQESLTVRADANLMPYIKAEVKNGTLILGFTDEVKNKHIRPTERIKFNLSVKDITGLDVSGAGDVNVASLDTDRLEILVGGAGDISISSLTAEELVVHLNGAGRVELAGQVAEQNIKINGFGAYQAAKLESQTAIVGVNGAGSATLWATDTLDVRIPGAGSVTYYGNPSVTKKITGVGTVISRGNL